MIGNFENFGDFFVIDGRTYISRKFQKKREVSNDVNIRVTYRRTPEGREAKVDELSVSLISWRG